jgi:hypothetical protein
VGWGFLSIHLTALLLQVHIIILLFNKITKLKSFIIEPIYDNRGIRINTREFRTRKKLEEERQILVQRVMQLDPTFQPPPGTSLVVSSNFIGKFIIYNFFITF